MGGTQAHEFMVLNPAGGDVLVLCEACDYAANRRSRRPTTRDRGDPLPLEVETPGATTIAALAAFPGEDPDRKAAFVTGDGRLITAIVRDARSTRRSWSTRSRPSADPAGQVERSKAAGWALARGARGTTTSSTISPRVAQPFAGPAARFHLLNMNAGRDYVPVVADIDNAGRRRCHLR